MRRLRFFRVLLPAVLVLFVVLLALAYRERVPIAPESAPQPRPESSRRVENLNIVELVGEEQTLDFVAGLVEENERGEYHLESITRLALPTDDGLLLITAERGEILGAAGERMMHFAGGVVITDPEEGMVLTLPVLDVDEAAGEARCDAELRLEGGPLNGRAARLVYGLAGQPSRLDEVELENAAGARLTADTAWLHDGLDDVELVGRVRTVRGDGEHLDAERMRLRRDANDVLRRVEAEEAVSGSLRTAAGLRVRLRSEHADVRWDAAGAPERLVLEGGAELGHGTESMAAERIQAIRGAASGADWSVRAEGTVYLQGLVGSGPAWLRASRLEATLGADMSLRSAAADEQVRFDGPDTRADADRAELRAGSGATEVRLLSRDRGKARLARGRTRVAAEQIVTDARGETLVAEGRVEASLLPVPAGAAGVDRAVPAMFDNAEAVHFVSETLEGSDFGGELAFSGNVRAWQEDRNLSAERVVLDQRARTLTARERVSTRIPRSAGTVGTAEADYVQITSDRLDYDDAKRLAVFEDAVRARLAEGWLESVRLEVQLLDGQSGIEELRAAEQVNIEFREPSAEGSPEMLAGRSDRLTYRPDEDSVWLFGDAAPASVRRIGKGGGTTSGRVLRYRLSTGALEVDAGELDTATIRTKGN